MKAFPSSVILFFVSCLLCAQLTACKHNKRSQAPVLRPEFVQKLAKENLNLEDWVKANPDEREHCATELAKSFITKDNTQPKAELMQYFDVLAEKLAADDKLKVSGILLKATKLKEASFAAARVMEWRSAVPTEKPRM